MAFATVASVLVAAAVVTTASAGALCSPPITVDNGDFWACVEGDCVTGHISYPGITTNPTITLCEQKTSDGSVCYTVSSQNICNDIPLLTSLALFTPDLSGTIWISTGFQSLPPKVCFQPPDSACPSTTQPPPTVTASPITTAPPQGSNPLQLSQSDRQAIVDRHNYFRKTTVPTAANMKKMTYDLSLEQFAQSYLDGLIGCPLQHNPQDVYGENLYLGYSFGNTAYTVDYKSIVSGWHDEYYYYDYNNNKCNAPPDKSCGHYKQIVWDDTESVGCGMKQCHSGSWTETMVVCNYNPSGNAIPIGGTIPRQPFKTGSSCSLCPSSHSACQQGFCVEPVELAREQLQATNVEVEEEGKVGEGGWDPRADNSVLEFLTHAREQNTANGYKNDNY